MMTAYRFLLRTSIALALSAGSAFSCADTYVEARVDAAKAGALFPEMVIHTATSETGRTVKLHENPCGAEPEAALPVLPVLPGAVDLANLMFRHQIQILDIRPSQVSAAGMLPQSISMPYSNWHQSRHDPSAPISEARLAEVIGAAGIRLSQPIVIVHQDATELDTGRAALVYWLLKSAGAERLSILSGGFAAWREIGLPESASAHQAMPYVPQISLSREWFADDVLVYGIATGQVPGHLMDVRAALAQGFESDPVLPGADVIPVGALLVDNVLNGEEEASPAMVSAHLTDVLAEAGSGPVVSAGETRELAALSWFMGSEVAGLAGFKLYPDMLSNWNKSKTRVLVSSGLE